MCSPKTRYIDAICVYIHQRTLYLCTCVCVCAGFLSDAKVSYRAHCDEEESLGWSSLILSNIRRKDRKYDKNIPLMMIAPEIRLIAGRISECWKLTRYISISSPLPFHPRLFYASVAGLNGFPQILDIYICISACTYLLYICIRTYLYLCEATALLRKFRPNAAVCLLFSSRPRQLDSIKNRYCRFRARERTNGEKEDWIERPIHRATTTIWKKAPIR